MKGSLFFWILLGLALVVAGLIAVPGLLRSRIGSGETSPIGSLKSFSAAQEQFRSQKLVDQDQDGEGEYGTIGELSGNRALRGGGRAVSMSPFLPSIFEPTGPGGSGVKSGYFFIVYLCGKTRSFTDADVQTGQGVDLQEQNFVAYAWPQQHGKTGTRVFAMDAQGTIMQLANSDGTWSGDHVPPPGLAFQDGRDPAVGSGVFVMPGDKGGAKEAWRPVG